MKHLRFIARVAGALSVLVAVVICAVALLFNSETFSRWLMATVAERSDGMLRIESVSGTFGGGLSIGAVDIELDSVSVSATTIKLNLDWRSLVARSFIADDLRIQRLEIVVAQEQSASRAVAPEEFSTLVLIRELEFAELDVTSGASNAAIRDTTLELRLLRNRLELNDVVAAYDQLALNGGVAVTLTDGIEVEGSLCVDGIVAQERAAGCIEVEGDLQGLQLDARLRLPFTLAVAGTVVPSRNGSIELAGAWLDAAPGVLDDVMSPGGTLRVSGTTSRPGIEADGSLTYQDQTADFAVDAVLDGGFIDLNYLRLDHGGATAQASGDFNVSSGNGQFVLELRGVEPQRWISEVSGTLDASAELAVTLQPEIEVVVDDIIARGELRGFPVAGVGAMTYRAESLHIDALQLVSRSDRIVLSGILGNDIDVDVQASIDNLGILAEDARGALSADLHISGSTSRPAVRGAINLTDARIGNVGADALRITGNVGFEPDDALELAVFADEVRVADTSLLGVVLSVDGTAAAHRLDARLAAATWSSRLVSAGTFFGRNWSGRIDEFDFVPDNLGLWTLRVPAEVRYGESGYSVSELCLTWSLSSVCGSVSVVGSSDDFLEASAVNFDLSILEPFMPPNLRAKGLVNADGMLSNFDSQPRGAIEFEATDAQVDLLLAEDVALPIPIAELQLSALLDEGGATISAHIDAVETGSVDAQLVVDEPLDENSPLHGSVSLQWHDASALAVLSPDVDSVQGRFDAELGIAGTLAEPLLDGAANWSEGALEVPAWGLVVDHIDATINASESREAVFAANGLIDSTPVEIDGSILLDAEQGWPMQLELAGEDLPLVQLADMELRVSPRLEAHVRLPEIRVSGRVGIPHARIRDVALPQQAVVPSPDTVVHGQDLDVRARPLDLIADLVLELSDDVTYEDARLRAAVAGRLNLNYRSGQGAVAQGALRLSGQYDAYGTPLDLERGQLLFAGPLDNPSFDMLAVREVGEVTAGVRLTGTLRAPVTAVFSDPAMSEADALSWLLFARPLDAARETDSSSIRNAALSMGLQQALPVIERIGETLRLDDFAIRSTQTDAGALMAGKYLSPKLYFRYSYGLFDRIGGLLLRYRINNRFSLETRSGEHSSMDLLYTLEKD